MSAKKTGEIIASRIIRLVEDDDLMQALEELEAVAEFNSLEELSKLVMPLKENLTELEGMSRAKLIPLDLGARERWLFKKQVVALASEVKKIAVLRIPESMQKGVSILLNPAIEVSESQQKDLFQTLKRIFGVKESEIQIFRGAV